MICATTTAVNEQWYRQATGTDRLETDVRAYNDVARDLAGRFGVIVNDLYEVVIQAGRDKLLAEDGVHFTPEGYTVLGKAVAEVARQYVLVN